MNKIRTRPRSAPDLAVAVRDAREQMGKTQSELAAQIGAPRSWVSQFENGKARSANLGRVFALLEALDISVEITYSYRSVVNSVKDSHSVGIAQVGTPGENSESQDVSSQAMGELNAITATSSDEGSRSALSATTDIVNSLEFQRGRDEALSVLSVTEKYLADAIATATSERADSAAETLPGSETPPDTATSESTLVLPTLQSRK